MTSSSDSSSKEDINIHRRVNTRINYTLEIGEHEAAFRFSQQIIDNILLDIGKQLNYTTNPVVALIVQIFARVLSVGRRMGGGRKARNHGDRGREHGVQVSGSVLTVLLDSD